MDPEKILRGFLLLIFKLMESGLTIILFQVNMAGIIKEKGIAVEFLSNP